MYLVSWLYVSLVYNNMYLVSCLLCMYVCLFVCLPVCLSVCLFVVYVLLPPHGLVAPEATFLLENDTIEQLRCIHVVSRLVGAVFAKKI